jgi:tRNA (cmo5U34)-methyltransferase
MKASFDSIAWCYDFLAGLVFGNRIKQSQRVLLHEIKAYDKVLIIGGGTGWILDEILNRTTFVRIDYIEHSTQMLKKARAALNPKYKAQVEFILGDESAVLEKSTYDVVIAFYFFDLFKEEHLDSVVSIVSKSLKLSGRLLYADFNITPTSRWFHKILVKVMYMFFRYLCGIEALQLVGMEAVFYKYSFVRKKSISSSNGLILSEVYIKM